jgi:hypothetical protein
MDIRSFARSEWGNGERNYGDVADRYVKAALACEDPESALTPAVFDAMSDAFRRLRKALEESVGSWDADPDGTSHGRQQQERLPLAPVGDRQDHGRDLIQAPDDSHRSNGETPAVQDPAAEDRTPVVQGNDDGQEVNGGRGAQCRNDSQARNGTPATPIEQRIQLLNEVVWIMDEGGSGKGHVIPWQDVTIDGIERTLRFYGGELRGIRKKSGLLESARTVMIRHRVYRLGDVPRDALLGVFPDEQAA